ncbi:unnamed protein product [Psylliodes chrysocephalus]|uniref:Double jelly roll-like domain-containing protein n=1 Tax=Psylliodes chrysocephalus TaxID=3402493 RepID=A0A9P0GEZ5_9CUCU|nr:unnamed protein product [Psylliodes chrysocephala]
MYKRKRTEEKAHTHTSSIFDLYQSPTFDESIRKSEYRSYTPFIKSFNCNDSVEFNVNQVDSFFAMFASRIAIKGKLEVTGKGDVTLAPNFGGFLFDSCTYSESAREVETVRDPGIVSAIRAYTCYNKDDANHMSIAGWNYPSAPILSAHDKSFSLLMPLKHIFNIFNDYPMITCGRQTFRFVRARNDNDCVIIKEKVGETGTTAKIVIESIELKIKHIYPNDDVKQQLLKSIQTDKPILIPFRKWDLNELPTITAGARREIWAVKTSTAIERPRFIIVCFQTDKRDAVEADPTLFDHVNTASIRVSLNGEYYPNERMQLDFANSHFAEAHFNYSDFQAMGGAMCDAMCGALLWTYTYTNKNLDEIAYQNHLSKKDEARTEKESYNSFLPSTSSLFCYVSSIQLSMSSLYYKTKLIVHNFTLFNLKSKKGYCYK